MATANKELWSFPSLRQFAQSLRQPPTQISRQANVINAHRRPIKELFVHSLPQTCHGGKMFTWVYHSVQIHWLHRRFLGVLMNKTLGTELISLTQRCSPQIYEKNGNSAGILARNVIFTALCFRWHLGELLVIPQNGNNRNFGFAINCFFVSHYKFNILRTIVYTLLFLHCVFNMDFYG